MNNNTVEIHLVFALGYDYKPKTLIGAARTLRESWLIQDDHLRRREAPMANGCQAFSMATYPANAEVLLQTKNPFPYRNLEW